MFRALFVSLSKAAWAQDTITRTPVSRQMARRFVAGESIDDAIEAIRALNAGGINATLDFLGESVSDRDMAKAAAAEYVRALDAIDACGVRANVSLKLTQFGLDIDRAFCHETVAAVIAHAKAHGNFVRIDMEGTPHTDVTLEILDGLRREFDNVGIVLQSYLFRTEADLEATAKRGIPVRLCKGAYQEPSQVAFPDKHDVDLNYIKLARHLMDLSLEAAPASADGRTPALAALATHDVAMLHAVTRHAERRHIPRDRFELQMLYGIRRDLQDHYATEGYAVRAYVPYGTHWYPYFMRRLAERPANVWFLASNALR
jgi:proline dehydrogenase